jgi:hypothetical protein
MLGMPVIALRYAFRQPFRASAEDAFAWCTDFQPSDAVLFQDGRSRTVRRYADDTFLTTDTPRPGGSRPRITRIVRICPEELSWTNTHLTGPFRYSQFWYRIERDGMRRSHLEFRGLKLERHSRRIGPSVVARRARAEGRSDAETWRTQLAPALNADVGE